MIMEENLKKILFYEKEYDKENNTIQENIRILISQIDALREKINLEAILCLKNKDVTQAKELVSKVEECQQISEILDNIINKSYINNRNPKQSYSLQDKFEGKSISSFEINSQEFKVNNWKELLISTLNFLLEKDKDNFLDMVKKDKVRGISRKYFGFEKDNMRSPRCLKDCNIWVETHHSSRDIVRIIREVLDVLKINQNEYKIYLRE